MYDDDFITDSEGENQDNEEEINIFHATQLHKPIHINESPDFFENEEIQADTLLRTSLKLDKLSQTLNVESKSTKKLYSILFLLFEENEKILRKFGGVIPTDEINKFHSNLDISTLTQKQLQSLKENIQIRRNLIETNLKLLFIKSLQKLNDSNDKVYRQYDRLKHFIKQVKQSNNELSLKTRQQANRLTKEPTSKTEMNDSDILIHQQRLQKSKSRIAELKSFIETAQHE
jgi:hypothetical protein